MQARTWEVQSNIVWVNLAELSTHQQQQVGLYSACSWFWSYGCTLLYCRSSQLNLSVLGPCLLAPTAFWRRRPQLLSIRNRLSLPLLFVKASVNESFTPSACVQQYVGG